MADMDYFGAEYDGTKPSAGPVSRPRRRIGGARFVNWAGAATSLGLIGITGAWAVDIALRDVTDVPVIRAAEGPMRVAPEEPGGMTAPYQGLALSDITSGGAAAPTPEQIALAPAPIELAAPSMSERSARVAELETPSEPEPADPALASVGADALALPGPLTAPEAGRGVDVAMLDLPAEHRAGGEDGSREAGSRMRDVQADVAEILSQLAAESGVPADKLGGLGTSSPEADPEAARIAAAKLEAAPMTMPQASDRPARRPAIWRASLSSGAAAGAVHAPGTPAAQVGSFESEAGARAEWDRLSGLFAPLMADKQRLIDRAEGGGRSFWRLRVVGFEQTAQAQAFCETLLEGRASCLSVTIR